MSIRIEPINDRAATAHDAPDAPDALDTRAQVLVEKSAKALSDRLNAGVRTVQAEVKNASDALTRLATGQENAADVALASRVMNVASIITEKATKLIEADAAVKIPQMLTMQMPQLVHALMPGISVKDVMNAMMIANELVQQAKDPNLNNAAAVFAYVRGTPSRSTREGGRLGDHLTTTILNAMMGEPFNRGRFLSGALRASSKDMKARALVMREEERSAGRPK
ncbi:hypothetical protein [Deinococcus sp. UR1]|uniref:hypothetical protein n=1 Tax=Deinococcus sp. UR1 TaxID=1704277 RepID=UPI000C1803B5|nr:hypothetical protein [Deinococcus sp. UR1]PIG96873.1 hypothetical protein AMD26_015200 [Deinococcus sp. UR1]